MIATVILIAVTVAVSIAVAAWTGALSRGFMTTEQLSITIVTNTANTATIYVSNTGTTSVTISQVWAGSPLTQVATSNLAFAGNSSANTFAGNSAGTITVSNQAFTSSNSYQFKLTTARGNRIQYTIVAS